MVGAKRWRWRLLRLALLLGLHSVLSDAVGVALLPRLVRDLEPRHGKSACTSGASYVYCKYNGDTSVTKETMNF